MQDSVIHINKGIAKLESKDYVNAIFEFNQAVMIDPNNESTYLGRGMAYIAQGNYTKAISDLNKAIEIDPNCGRAYYLRGELKFHLEDKSGACQDWREVAELGFKEYYEMTKDHRKNSNLIFYA